METHSSPTTRSVPKSRRKVRGITEFGLFVASAPDRRHGAHNTLLGTSRQEQAIEGFNKASMVKAKVLGRRHRPRSVSRSASTAQRRSDSAPADGRYRREAWRSSPAPSPRSPRREASRVRLPGGGDGGGNPSFRRVSTSAETEPTSPGPSGPPVGGARRRPKILTIDRGRAVLTLSIKALEIC